MSKTTRKKLFFLALLAFILVSVVTLFLAFGYGYDFKDYRLVKTGSLSLRTNLGANVFVDNRLAGHTALISNLFSEKRLLPGKYTLRVEKDGFWPWRKVAEIQESLITDFSKITLIKKELSEESWSVSQKNKLASFFWGQEKSQAFSVDKNNGVILDFGKQEIVAHFFLPEKFSNPAPVFYQDHFYTIDRATLQKSLKVFDPLGLKEEKIRDQVGSFTFLHQDIILTDAADGQLLRFHPETKKEEKISNLFLSPWAVLREAAEINGVIYLLIDRGLYAITNEGKAAVVTPEAEKFALAPDGYSLAWINGGEVWTIALKDNPYQPAKLTGAKELVTRLSQPIKDLAWYSNSSYLFLLFSQSLQLIETDTRYRPNTYHLTKLEAAEKFKYFPDSGKVMILDGGRLKTFSLQ